jgi:hypothetical protein
MSRAVVLVQDHESQCGWHRITFGRHQKRTGEFSLDLLECELAGKILCL